MGKQEGGQGLGESGALGSHKINKPEMRSFGLTQTSERLTNNRSEVLIKYRV